MGLICLSGGSKGPINDALFHKQNDKAEEELLFLKEVLVIGFILNCNVMVGRRKRIKLKMR